MKKSTRQIIKAVSTLFFEEGFDREKGVHSLNYWLVEHTQLERCRCVKVRDRIHEDGFVYGGLFINTAKIGNDWFVRVYDHVLDSDGDFDHADVHGYIRVDPERLCWEEFVDTCEFIEKFY